MIKIVREEKEIKEYINGIKRLFEIYKSIKQFNIKDSFLDENFNKLMGNLDNNVDYSEDTLKGEILRENILGNKSLSHIAEDNAYSVAHVYSVKQKILKEFAAITFEVVLI